MQDQRSAWITPREAEILGLIAAGLADKEIAGRLGVTARTVGTHLERLFARLHVHSRAQALAWYYGHPVEALGRSLAAAPSPHCSDDTQYSATVSVPDERTIRPGGQVVAAGWCGHPPSTAATASGWGVLSAVVEDYPGVLTRVAGIVRRHGFHIQGMSIGPTDQAGRSRLMLKVDAADVEVDQVQEQLHRLIDVIESTYLSVSARLSRELALVRLAVRGSRREMAVAEVDRLGGRVVGSGPKQMIVEFCGEFEKVERFLEALRPYRICEVARSGTVSVSTEDRH